MSKQLDNGSFTEKLLLRRKVLKALIASGQQPVIMETNGGFGELYRAAYSRYDGGAVIEKDPTKADALAEQRPTWAVYRADCVTGIAGGLGAHLHVNFLDVDPYGECWPIIDAWFASRRPRPTMWIVVNDGLRQALRMNNGWNCASMRWAVEKYGNENLQRNYLQICREMLTLKAAAAGYDLSNFTGYYCGHADNMTHFAALLTAREEGSALASVEERPAPEASAPLGTVATPSKSRRPRLSNNRSQSETQPTAYGKKQRPAKRTGLVVPLRGSASSTGSPVHSPRP